MCYITRCWDDGEKCAKHGDGYLKQGTVISYESNGNYIITNDKENIICYKTNLKDYMVELILLM